MRIYTRTGDRGTTGLFGGGRVGKAHPRVEAYGTVDELNSILGWALDSVEVESSRRRLGRIQHDLFALGAALATPGPRGGERPLPAERVGEMEGWIDEADEALPELRAFILPGGTAGAAVLHVARTVCRRAERAVVALAGIDDEDGGGDVRGGDVRGGEEQAGGGEGGDEEGGGDEERLAAVLRYLNRLSDLLFVLARLENRHAGREDVVWEREPGREGEGG